MTETEARTLIALTAFIISYQDIPSQIVNLDKDEQYYFSGSNADLDDSQFSLRSNQLGTIYIQVSNNIYQAEVGGERVQLTISGSQVQEARDDKHGQSYRSFQVSQSSVEFRGKDSYQFRVYP
jgi:hypothetical protein